MIVEVGIVELLGTRLAVAFVDASYIRPGAGDDLLQKIDERLRYLTHASLMLYSDDGRSYAPFQSHHFAARIRRKYVTEWHEIDVLKSWNEYQPEPTF